MTDTNYIPDHYDHNNRDNNQRNRYIPFYNQLSLSKMKSLRMFPKAQNDNTQHTQI